MGVGQLSESDAVDALRLPFYPVFPIWLKQVMR